MKLIHNLEIHAVHSCNLACESCAHYSNQGHKGILALEEAGHWMQIWSPRVLPHQFHILGGEPTIHPRLPELVVLARKHWPRSNLKLTSNGFFLHRHPGLPAALRDTGTKLCLSIHHDAPEYRQKALPGVQLARQWHQTHGIDLELIPSAQKWTRRYLSFGSAMAPFEDGNPRQSWKICPARHCRQLHDGKIWKCAPLAYLRMQDARYHLSEKWQHYLQYRPLEPDCTDAELHAFFDRQEESYCGMCPAIRRPFKLPVPLVTIGTKAGSR